MAEYNGSIELISGIKPKNNGEFPLVNARDVQVDDTGKRLDEVLASILANGGGGGNGSYTLTEADIALIVQRVLAELKVYSGNYEVTPSTQKQQLPTAQAIMEQDLFVKEIPYSEVSNNEGGKTVNIG